LDELEHSGSQNYSTSTLIFFELAHVP